MSARLRIGLVFDLLGSAPPGGPPDADAEYEPEATVCALEAAVRAAGHEPLRLGNPHALLAAIGARSLPQIDAAWNIAEGYGTRNREAWAPVLLELAQIPALGSDALTLSLSLDKAWTLDLVRAAGVPTAGHLSVASREALVGAALPGAFPLFVKPRWEGTAKGIELRSRVANERELGDAVERVVRSYQQPALVEPFLPGAEYTVTVIGNDPPRALPVLQRALELSTGIGVHAVERRDAPEALSHYTPGSLTPELEAVLSAHALRAFAALRCCDFARIDFKLDARGEPRFLEINTLPTFAPDASFGILAELMGQPLEHLLAEVLRGGLRRLGLE